ncbi:MAG: hypothetical protein U9R19_00190 [Bacteroidota bacterium]|nr:hypothetical protein [Bacteroidota bacterium]
MCKDVLITGVTVTQQIKMAKEILKNQVIPQEKKFQQRKQRGSLSHELISAMKSNA